VRSIGLLAGVQLDAPWFEERGVPLTEAAVAVRERGQLSRLLASGALQFSPPFVSTEDDIAGFAAATADALDSLA
jgi:adenosylmethionine-8-amino-7-oxononanoate aminotransferase